jgi:heat-inducible transcriptional repressor
VNALEDLEKVRTLFDLLETREQMMGLLEMVEGAEGVQIFIGAENDLFQASGCSLIVAPYYNESKKVIGALGVIGPKRLNYGRIIPMVDYTARMVGKLIGA